METRDMVHFSQTTVIPLDGFVYSIPSCCLILNSYAKNYVEHILDVIRGASIWPNFP